MKRWLPEFVYRMPVFAIACLFLVVIVLLPKHGFWLGILMAVLILEYVVLRNVVHHHLDEIEKEEFVQEQLEKYVRVHTPTYFRRGPLDYILNNYAGNKGELVLDTTRHCLMVYGDGVHDLINESAVAAYKKLGFIIAGRRMYVNYAYRNDIPRIQLTEADTVSCNEYIGSDGEVWLDKDRNMLRIYDGVAKGGYDNGCTDVGGH